MLGTGDTHEPNRRRNLILGSRSYCATMSKKPLVPSVTSTVSKSTGETIRQVLDWQSTIVKHLRCQHVLSTTQLLELASFLNYLASWCQRLVETNIELCVFCRNNNAPFEMYTTHKVKDSFGRVTCPVLRQFTCPVCGSTGDQAHTIRYCPWLSTGATPRVSANNNFTNAQRSTTAISNSTSLMHRQTTSVGPSSQLIEAGLLHPEAFSF
ncbi:nanos homolog 1 [Clonorchis sinensis]|uniref:Nanos homolog 1 n=1 Tax=Clonorchis sinensis TaxID=79923 RepID=G7Y6A0_CLOSI|nr:nanos homolog 1 [Clonorchis sinensis]